MLRRVGEYQPQVQLRGYDSRRKMAGSIIVVTVVAFASIIVLEASAFSLGIGPAMLRGTGTSRHVCLSSLCLRAGMRPLRPFRPLRSHRGPLALLSLEIRAHSSIVDWVAANGGYVHPAVTLSDKGDAGVGLSLSAPVPAGQVLVAVPPRLQARARCMHYACVYACPSNNPILLQVTLSRLTGDEAVAVENEVPAGKWDFRLALALIALIHESQNAPAATAAEKPVKSKQPKADGFGTAPEPAALKRSSVEWQTYIETLPQKLDSLPVFFTGAQLREFETEFPAVQGIPAI